MDHEIPNITEDLASVTDPLSRVRRPELKDALDLACKHGAVPVATDGTRLSGASVSPDLRRIMSLGTVAAAAIRDGTKEALGTKKQGVTLGSPKDLSAARRISARAGLSIPGTG